MRFLISGRFDLDLSSSLHPRGGVSLIEQTFSLPKLRHHSVASRSIHLAVSELVSGGE